MPRPNRRREIDTERHVSARVEQLRIERGWSYASLASRMTEAGCPIADTALHRSIKGDPPRRVTVNELAALALVFQLDVRALLVPPKVAASRRAMELVNEWARLSSRGDELQAEIDRTDTELQRVFDDLRGVIEFAPETRVEVERFLTEAAEASRGGPLSSRRAVQFRMWRLTGDEGLQVGIEDLVKFWGEPGV